MLPLHKGPLLLKFTYTVVHRLASSVRPAPESYVRAFSWVSRMVGTGQAHHFAQSDLDLGFQAKRIQGLERDVGTFHQTREKISLYSSLVSHWVKSDYLKDREWVITQAWVTQRQLHHQKSHPVE